MKRKPIFFTSDWHIGHKNVLDFSNRPFRDIDHMTSSLIKRYNSVVPENGVCYFLGDMGLCSSGILTNVLSKLNGTKILILGNHDKGMEAMYKVGFDVVMYGATLQICKQRVTLSHCPLLGVFREDTTNMRGSTGNEHWHGSTNDNRKRYSTQDVGQYHLQGHVHSPNSGQSLHTLQRQFDVGVDANKYTPVSLSKIESWIVKTELLKTDLVKIEGAYERVNRLGEVIDINGTPLKVHKRFNSLVCVIETMYGFEEVRVCVIVANAFLPTPPEGSKLIHKNGHKLDNSASNLKWVKE